MKQLFTFLLIGLFSGLYAKDTCQVGVFVTDVYGINLAENSFDVNFWMWMNYKNDSLVMLENAELTNAKSHSYSLATVETRDHLNYGAQKVNATIKKNWDIRNFPLDKQALWVHIESGDLDTSDLVFSADRENSILDERVLIEGWILDTMKVESGYKTYKTNYGDPWVKGSNSFASFSYVILIHRDGWGLFLKIFTGLYVAFAISLLVYFMGAENHERFGLLVGALFAGVANKYIVDSLLPETTTYTLVDKIHVVAFIFILLNLIITVITYRTDLANKKDLAKRIDRVSFWAILGIFIAFNIWQINAAVSG